jgi:hypothetical protein
MKAYCQVKKLIWDTIINFDLNLLKNQWILVNEQFILISLAG